MQGDEPLINPNDIDKTLNFYSKKISEIVVPHIRFNLKNKGNIVKLLINEKIGLCG